MTASPSRLSRTPVILLGLRTQSADGREQILHLARCLMDSPRFTPVVAATRHSALLESAQGENLPILPLGSRGPFCEFSNRWRLKKLLREAPAAVLHSQDLLSARLAHAVVKAVPGVIHVHTKRDALPVPSGKTGRALREARAVVALSSSMGALLTSCGIEGGRVRIIPSGIAPDAVPKRRQREDGRFIFAVMGDLLPENGHEVLIRALPLLERYEDMPEWEIRVLGEGGLFHPLLELAMTLGVKGRLALLGKQNAAAILPWCDALIAPAVNAAMHGEDNGAPVREAWAVGLPLIASNLLAHCELARERENGLIYPLDDPAALAACMADVARSAAIRRQLCAGGEISLAACTAKDMGEAYATLYERLLFPGARRFAA